MRLLRISLLIALASSSLKAQTVNALVGDSSWLYTHQYPPSYSSPDKERITAHLHFVIKRLKAKCDFNGNHEARKKSIAHLEDYLRKGEFPRNFNYPFAQRRPCFMDDNGRLCAVGHLISNSSGTAEAARINAKFRFHYILEIDDPRLITWQKKSGLSLTELAMIQPAYKTPATFFIYKNRRSKYGLKRRSTHRIAIWPRYETIYYSASQTFFWAQKNEEWHIFNSFARRINFHAYDTVFLWRGTDTVNLLASRENHIEAINDKGKLRWKRPNIKIQFTAHDQFIGNVNGLLGIYNWQGEVVKNPQYEDITPLFTPSPFIVFLEPQTKKNLFYKVRKGTKWGLINRQGETIISAEWDEIGYMRGIFTAKNSEQGTCLFLNQGERLLLNGIKAIEPALGNSSIRIETENGTGILNGFSGAWEIKPATQIVNANLRYYYVQDSTSKWGLFDRLGAAVFSIDYDSIKLIDRHVFLYQQGKMALGNLQGVLLLPPKFDEVNPLLADGSLYTNQLFYTRNNGVFRIFDELGRERYADWGLSDFKPVQASIGLLTKNDTILLAQFFKDELLLFPEMQIERMHPIAGLHYVYTQRGQQGVAQIFYNRIIDTSKFQKAQFDSLIPIPGPRDHSLYLAQQNNLWGVYNAQADSLFISTEFLDFYPSKLAGSHSGWIYFLGADRSWMGYFYTSPKLNFLSPVSQKSIMDKYLAEKKSRNYLD